MSKPKKKTPKITDKLICPNCKGTFTPDLFNGSGNYEEACDNCDAEIGFHVEIEYDGVHLVNE